jgi:hypothetical protein
LCCLFFFFWPLCCLFFFFWPLCSHFSFICMFCRSLFVFLCFFFLPLCCLFFTLQILITCLVSIGHCVVCPSLYRFWLPVWYLLVIVLSVLRFTDSDYLFGIYWPLCCLFFTLQILITCLISIGHCVVCPLLYRFWLPV